MNVQLPAPSLTSDQLRVHFAAERTLLAWVRTGLAMMGFGFIVARFGLFLNELALIHEELQPSFRPSLWFGISLIALGVTIHVVSATHYLRFVQRLKQGEAYLQPGSRFAIGLSLVLAGLGIAMAWFLLRLAL